MTQKIEALRLLEETLNELESKKGSISIAIQKLFRAAFLVGEEDIKIWCSIQFADSRFIPDLEQLLKILTSKDKSKEKEQIEHLKKLKELGIKPSVHLSSEELNIKYDKSGGGYVDMLIYLLLKRSIWI